MYLFRINIHVPGIFKTCIHQLISFSTFGSKYLQCSVCIKIFCQVTRSGYHGIESGRLSMSTGSQHRNINPNCKESLKFLDSQVGLPATKIRQPERISLIILWQYPLLDHILIRYLGKSMTVVVLFNVTFIFYISQFRHMEILHDL